MHYTTLVPPRRSPRKRSNTRPAARRRTTSGPAPAGGDAGLLARVGRSVREARRGRRLTRGALATLSGVSERFIARIESGTGNVSLVRLNDLARALALPLVSLVAAAPADGGPRVALVGLRGAGKSTLGPPLARALGVPFRELDALIEEAAGLPLGQIFEIHGERYFRRLEREVLARLIASGPAVIATGGGLVTDPETWGLVRATCTTVWLSAAPEDHYSRVLAQGDRRPMAGKADAMAELKALLTARKPLYGMADLSVDTSRHPPRQTLRQVLERVEGAER
jgi:XRE family transcriptional regulator, aerobic/anaerobic benzoate catabolism transcriptional regulator